MVFREVFATQDLRRMSKHAERHHETKQLLLLSERLNRQMAERGKAGATALPKSPAPVLPIAAPPN